MIISETIDRISATVSIIVITDTRPSIDHSSWVWWGLVFTVHSMFILYSAHCTINTVHIMCIPYSALCTSTVHSTWHTVERFISIFRHIYYQRPSHRPPTPRLSTACKPLFPVPWFVQPRWNTTAKVVYFFPKWPNPVWHNICTKPFHCSANHHNKLHPAVHILGMNDTVALGPGQISSW